MRYFREVLILSATLPVLLAGCAQQRILQETQVRNALLEHEVARLRREVNECSADLDRAQRELAAAREAATPVATTAPAATDETVRELEAALADITAQRDHLAREHDRLSRQLMETERKLAEHVQESARSVREIRELEERVAQLTSQLERQQRALEGGTVPAAPPQ